MTVIRRWLHRMRVWWSGDPTPDQCDEDAWMRDGPRVLP